MSAKISSDRFRNRYRVPSARAEWHDYNCGRYFITICTRNRVPYFGWISNKQMHFTEIGKYAHECVPKITELHPDVFVPSWQVMPDHVHLLVVVHKSAGTPYRVSQNHYASNHGIGDKPKSHMEAAMHCGRLSHIIGQYKTAVSRYARKRGIPLVWQERFYDCIVHDETSYAKIRAYIENNVRACDGSKK